MAHKFFFSLDLALVSKRFLTTVVDCTVPRRKMIMKNENLRIWRDVLIVYLKTLLPHIIEETTELCQDDQQSSQDFKTVPPKQKSGVLMSNQPAWDKLSF